ncbi:MAG: DUF853 domain-containing protein [Clostridium sp.]|nr:DUF853 domain-containing protein [Clostridium sp.]MCM1444538.1 DUF853 domain-containing protein [Candidatus Amulumruptor caecigallinarius]
MYINNKILIGKNNDKDIYLLPKMANRHGIISGASGSGKTTTLKVLAESFSSCGVPVLLVDVKGDLAGMCLPGTQNENIDKKIKELNIENFSFQNFPTVFWDVYEKDGHPIRTTVENIGSKLLSRMLNLSDAQEGVLTIVFKIAKEENLELIDLKDLKALLTYVGEKRKEYTLNYGNITLQSIGGIQRNLLSFEEEGGNYFFGKPNFDINDFIKFDTNNGYGHINILHAVTLFQKPNLYSTFLLWILNNLYNTLPEVGDLDKPKMIFFIDEAHLLFSEMPNHIIKQIIQIVKLIRSKGVGLYFISQSPSDIPNEILSQLGNRIQHVLRYYTKNDENAIKVAADSFRSNENFDTKEAIKTLKIGEALISLQDEYGQPTIVEKASILPPQSYMGTITDIKRKEIIENSRFYNKYEIRLDEDSAYEKIDKISQQEEVKKSSEVKQQKTKKQKPNKVEKAVTKLTNSTLNTLGRKIGNSLFKNLFK